LLSDEGGRRQEYEIRLAALSKSRVEVSSNTLEFPELRADDVDSKEVTITVHDYDPRTDAVTLESSPPNAAVTITELAEDGDSSVRRWRIACVVTGSAVANEPLTGAITVRWPSTVSPVGALQIRAQRYSHIGVKPPALSFGYIQPSTARRSISLQGKNGSSFRITSAAFVGADDGAFRAECSENRSNWSTSSTVTIEPKSTDTLRGRFVSAKLRVDYVVDDGTKEFIMVPVNGFVAR
jgi:hypothetical protein